MTTTNSNPLRSRRPSISSPQPPSSEFSTTSSLDENLMTGGTAASKARELLARSDVESSSPLLGSDARMKNSPSIYQRSMSPLPNGANSNSNYHNRVGSLTSACPPVTSSNGGDGEGSAYNSPILANNGNGRSWKYEWGGHQDEKLKGDDDKSSAKSSSIINSSLPRSNTWKHFDRILALPTTLLSYFLAPVLTPSSSSHLSRSHSHSHHLSTRSPPPAPSLNSIASPLAKLTKDKPSSSSSSSSTEKRWPLLVRIALILYLLFSVLQFSIGVLSHFGFVEKRTEGNSVNWKKVVEEKTGGLINLKRAEDYDDAVAKNDDWGIVKRIGSIDAKQNIISGMSHTYRFAKMHEKIHWDLHDEIEPFAFRATATPSTSDITALLYSTEAWIDTLPDFVENWQGPVSLVFELSHSRQASLERQNVLNRIEDLRKDNRLIRENVDWHFVGTPVEIKDRTLNKTRERLIFDPTPHNFHLNLARFFAKTDIVFQINDGRIIPSKGLRTRLMEDGIRDIMLERGDAVVVPTFGFIREDTLPNSHEIREKLEMPQSGYWDGIGSEEFEELSKEFVKSTLVTLPISISSWPTKKSQLVNLVSTKSSSVDFPIALYDSRWDLNHGPTNWYLWRKTSSDPKLLENPESGGGEGLGLNGKLGGGNDVYKVTDYDLHYSPNLVFSKQGQPWCTERFEHLSAACVYQLYLSGAEMWVLPDEWSFTLEGIEKEENKKEDPAEKLKNSISSRLYGKFHQEACMHYGREFLSVQMWDSDKAQHLRSVCARTLGSWGMGDA